MPDISQCLNKIDTFFEQRKDRPKIRALHAPMLENRLLQSFIVKAINELSQTEKPRKVLVIDFDLDSRLTRHTDMPENPTLPGKLPAYTARSIFTSPITIKDDNGNETIVAEHVTPPATVNSNGIVYDFIPCHGDLQDLEIDADADMSRMPNQYATYLITNRVPCTIVDIIEYFEYTDVFFFIGKKSRNVISKYILSLCDTMTLLYGYQRLERPFSREKVMTTRETIEFARNVTWPIIQAISNHAYFEVIRLTLDSIIRIEKPRQNIDPARAKVLDIFNAATDHILGTACLIRDWEPYRTIVYNDS